MTVFSNGKHDDQVDSTWPGKGPPRPVNVRIKAPPGTGAVQTFSGRHINVGLDGIVEMSEDDAFYLVPAGWTILGDVT
jgi:hypothetical protein